VDLAIIEDAPQGRTIVKLCGELDIASAPDLREQLLAILSRRTLSHLILDLSKLRFIDSSGIAVFVNTDRRARLLGCTLALVAPQAPVSRVLQVCGLDQHFLIVENIGAVAATDLKPRNAVGNSRPESTGAAR
jgi:anti-anti-sigma factor